MLSKITPRFLNKDVILKKSVLRCERFSFGIFPKYSKFQCFPYLTEVLSYPITDFRDTINEIVDRAQTIRHGRDVELRVICITEEIEGMSGDNGT